MSGHADADRDLESELAARRLHDHGRAPEDPPEVLGAGHAAVEVRLRHHQEELLAAVPADGVDRANVVPQDGGHVPQHLVTDGVAVGVVDPLEVIDVEHRDAQRPLVAIRAVDLAREEAKHGHPVQEACLGVGGRQGLDVGDSLRQALEGLAQDLVGVAHGLDARGEPCPRQLVGDLRDHARAAPANDVRERQGAEDEPQREKDDV